jgi:hypothetical protein
MSTASHSSSPIELLFGNIEHAFENANQTTLKWLKVLVDKGEISSAVEITDDSDFFPKVTKPNDGSPANIKLNVHYLERLWAFIYGWFVVYEECIQREILAENFKGKIEYSTPLKQRAGCLIAWSGLQARSSYPRELPSPNVFADTEEEQWVMKANQLFLVAVSIILHHEVAHVRYKHIGAAADESDRIQMENEADDAAHHEHLSQAVDEHTRRIKGWSVLAPILLGIWVSSLPRHHGSRSHPHMHHRLSTALRRLNFSQPENRDYFQYLCSTVLTAYKQRSDPKQEPREFETADEALETLLNEIDSGTY